MVVDLFGATVVSWILPSGKEMLYLSSLADRSGKAAIRGGIPVIFPQFSNGTHIIAFLFSEGPLMKHGFARISTWTSDPVFEEDGYSVCQFHLSSNEQTKKSWNHDFKLTYTVRVNASCLSTQLRYPSLSDISCLAFSTLDPAPSIASACCTPITHLPPSSPLLSLAFKTTKALNPSQQAPVEVSLSPLFYSTEFIEANDRISFSSETDAKYSDVTTPVECSFPC